MPSTTTATKPKTTTAAAAAVATDAPTSAPQSYPSLVAALAAFQRNLPSVRKGQTADVRGREGRAGYTYAYADLTDVSEEVLPALAAVGLIWHTGLDTVDGNVVLRWELAHADSDQTRTGTLPVGRAGNDWQSMGSSITYARRYALTAATGVAPGGDDDDAKSSVNAGTRPQAQPQTQKPVERVATPDYLPAGLYDLGSITSRQDAEAMFYAARRAQHLNLMLQTADGDVAFGAWLQSTGAALDDADPDAQAVAEHEATLADDEGKAFVAGELNG